MGPRPVSVDGGEIVQNADLVANPGSLGWLANSGTVIRFRPGIVRVGYAR